MSDNNFFDSQTDSSRVKANIVANYFPQYCKILLKKHKGNLMYLDLFAGPGLYADGNKSTPMLIGEACAKDEALRNRVILMFNDNTYGDTLKVNFEREFPEGTFAHNPHFGSRTVGEDAGIDNYLNKIRPKDAKFTPTLLFFDPFGYKGINSRTLANFMANFGNEIFLFFNIKRIHAAVENEKFDELMMELFPTTIEKIRNDRKYTLGVQERLALIIENLADEFKAIVPNVLHCAFKFQEEDSTATSHYIIHFTKHPKGYELVKQVYYDFDNIGATLEQDGTYTFDAKRMGNSANLSLDFGDSNADALGRQLVQSYKGKTIDAKSLFDEHHAGGKYCGSHYIEALRALVEKKQVKATFDDKKEHKVSVLLIPNCILEFANV